MSRPRSGRSSAPAGRTGAQRGVFVQQPKSDIYVTMLGIALGAMLIGSILLTLILAKYEFKLKATAVPGGTPAAIALLEKIDTVRL